MLGFVKEVKKMFDFFNTHRTFLTDCSSITPMIIGDKPSRLNVCGHHKRHFMTLVVALACKDGVVLAADGQTLGYALQDGKTYSMVFTACKIDYLGDNILWGGAGLAELIQKVETEFKKLPEEFKNSSLHDLKLLSWLRNTLHECNRPEIAAQMERGVPADQIIGAPLLFVSYDEKYHDDAAKIWSLGSLSHGMFWEQYGCGVIGDATLHTHMALLNYRSNLRGRKPRSKSLTTDQGCLVAYRAVKDAIEASPDRVGDPVDIWKIKKSEGPKQIVGDNKSKQEQAYLEWKEAEITALQNLI